MRVKRKEEMQNRDSQNRWVVITCFVVLLGFVRMIYVMMISFGYTEAFIALGMMLPAAVVGYLVIYWLGYPLRDKLMIGAGLIAMGWGGGWAVGFAQSVMEFALVANSSVGSDGIVREILPSAWTIVPFIEETFKSIGIILIYCLPGLRLKSVLAGIVIGACIGLGFSFIEDAGYVAADIMEMKDVTEGIGGALIRSMTIATHASFSTLIGAAAGYVSSRPMRRVKQIGMVFGAWLLAVCVHGFLNYGNTIFEDLATSVTFVIMSTFIWIVMVFTGAAVSRWRYKKSLSEYQNC